MATTFTKIASVAVGAGGASTMAFTSIPSTYTDLIVKVSARTSATSPEMTITFNGTSASNTDRLLYNYAGTAGSNTSSPMRASVDMSTQTANTFGNADIYVPNYAGATNKSASIEAVAESNSTTDAYQYLTAGLWSNTAAITTLTLTAVSGTFVQYSTATLYGISKS
jgi:hypothetical protein